MKKTFTIRPTDDEKAQLLAHINSVLNRACPRCEAELPLDLRYWRRRGANILCAKCAHAELCETDKEVAECDAELMALYDADHRNKLCPGCEEPILIHLLDPKRSTHAVDALGRVVCKKCRRRGRAAERVVTFNWAEEYRNESAHWSDSESVGGDRPYLELEAYAAYRHIKRWRSFNGPVSKYYAAMNEELEENFVVWLEANAWKENAVPQLSFASRHLHAVMEILNNQGLVDAAMKDQGVQKAIQRAGMYEAAQPAFAAARLAGRIWQNMPGAETYSKPFLPVRFTREMVREEAQAED